MGRGFSKMDEFVTLDIVSASDIFPNFHWILDIWYWNALSPKKIYAFIFSEIATGMTNW